MDRRTLLAIILSILIFTGWQKFYIEPRLPKRTESAAAATTSATSPTAASPAATGGAAPALSTQPASAAQVAEQSQKLATKTGDALIGNGREFFSGWTLKAYRQHLAPEAQAVDLKSVTKSPGELAFSFDDSSLRYLDSVRGNLSTTPNGAVWKYEDANVSLTREFSGSADQPWIDITVKGVFKTAIPKTASISLTQASGKDDPEAQDHQLVYYSNDALERVLIRETVDSKQAPAPVRYIGTTSRYFTLALLPMSPVSASAQIQGQGAFAGTASLIVPINGNTFSIPLKVYFGPKELDLLRAVDPALDHTVDLGWFTLFAYPLLKLLKVFYAGIKNYGLAIILLTILLKVLTYPLTYKSMKSMREMARIQPQIQRLKDRYKDDREGLNREMMLLMKNHGYNPMAGCLPILIQMPIFFALYRVLYSSIELYQAPFFAWIQDLSARDPFYVTPILLTLTMFVQQKMTPSTATDPAQQRMMQFMPIIFGAFMLPLPAGLTIYMLTNTITSIIQQVILNRKLGPVHAPAPAGAR